LVEVESFVEDRIGEFRVKPGPREDSNPTREEDER